MATLRTYWERIQSSVWLMCGVLCLFFALVFWAVSDKQEDVVELVKEPETEVEIQIQPEKVAATTHLGALLDEVKPLENTTRLTASGNHDAEFRGTKFITDQAKNLTIELFRAKEESVVKGFIQKQKDRSQLVYIRLSGENQQEQYVVLYGNYSNSNIAKSALAKLPIKLPTTLKPNIHPFSDYEGLVNDLGSDDLGITGKLHEVRLLPAAIPKVIAPPVKKNAVSEAQVPENVATSITVTRRDESGNVVDIKKTHSEVPVAPTATSE